MQLERKNAYWEISERDLRKDVFHDLKLMLEMILNDDFNIDTPDDRAKSLADVELEAIERLLKSGEIVDLREEPIFLGSDGNGEWIRGNSWQAPEMANLLHAAKVARNDDSLFVFYDPMRDDKDQIAFVGIKGTAFVDGWKLVTDPVGSMALAVEKAAGKETALNMVETVLESLERKQTCDFKP